jgi:hypothetical protein
MRTFQDGHFFGGSALRWMYPRNPWLSSAESLVAAPPRYAFAGLTQRRQGAEKDLKEFRHSNTSFCTLKGFKMNCSQKEFRQDEQDLQDEINR